MKIRDVVCSVGRSGFFNEDFQSIKAGAERDGFPYLGEPMSAGFKQIMQPGASISIMLVLEDGLVAFGDCIDVIFTGVAGRDPLFQPDQHIDYLRHQLRDHLLGRPVTEFKEMAGEVDRLEHQGQPLHTAIRYGVSQALLQATALTRRTTIAEVVAREYGCDPAEAPVPILASCDKDDSAAIDKMILKQADLLPHGAFANVDQDLGPDGEKLLGYTRDLIRRIARIGAPAYRPGIHLDIYGSIAELFRNDVQRIVGYLAKLEAAVDPLALYIESPAVMESRAAQIELFGGLRAAIREEGLSLKLIADEWCNTLEDIKEFVDAQATDIVQVKAPDLGGVGNTIEALLYAKNNGVGTCLGGSGNETDQSTRVTAQIGIACGPDFMLSKPGFGCDEALMIQTNEMQRTLALIERSRVCQDT